MPFFKYLFQTMYIKHTNINITCNPIDLGYAPSFLPIIFVLYSKMFNVDINVIILYVLFIITFYTSHSLYIRGSWIIKKTNDLRTFFYSFHYFICLFIKQFKYKYKGFWFKTKSHMKTMMYLSNIYFAYFTNNSTCMKIIPTLL